MDVIRTKVVGVSHRNPNGTQRQKIVARLSKGDRLQLVREPDNPYDRNAVAVYDGQQQIGYLRRELAEEVSAFVDEGGFADAIVSAVTGGPSNDRASYGVNIEVRLRDTPPADAVLRRPPAQNAAAPASRTEGSLGIPHLAAAATFLMLVFLMWCS